MENVDVKILLRTVYLTLQQYGYYIVSLKNEDLLEYVPKIEKVLMEYGLKDSDLFIKTPVLETYDKYKDFLIKYLYECNLGCFNEKYDTIILNCSDFYISKCQKLMSVYNDLIYKCCYFISDDIQFLEENTLQIRNKEKVKYKNN